MISIDGDTLSWFFIKLITVARPPLRSQCHQCARSNVQHLQVGHLQRDGSSAVSERPPTSMTWWVILWLTVLFLEEICGVLWKRATALRVRTRSEVRTRLPHCQPIPRCNDNNCPSVSPPAPLCEGRHRPTQAFLKPARWSVHLKPSWTDLSPCNFTYTVYLQSNARSVEN